MQAPTAVLTLALLSILAAVSPMPGQAAPSPEAMDPPATQAAPAPDNDAVVVISGGIGDKGIAEMQQQEKNYSVKVVFSGEGGIYLPDIDVTIADNQGKTVTHTTTQGPVLLARLKPGRYSLTASQDNKVKKLDIAAPAKGLKTYQVRMPISE